MSLFPKTFSALITPRGGASSKAESTVYSYSYMVIRDQCHTNISNQTTLLDGVDAGPPKGHVCGRGLNKSIYEGMNDISNVKVHLRTRSGNVNISEIYSIFGLFLES